RGKERQDHSLRMTMSQKKLSVADQIYSADSSLDLGNRTLKRDEVGMLAQFVANSRTLKVLSLYNVKVNAEDAVFLAKALEFNETLTSLSFEHNPIGEVGTAALAETIKFNTTIEFFSLANTVLNPKGCALLADALVMNHTLTTLNLESNRCGPEGARYLAEALRMNSALRHLSLDLNEVGDVGAAALADALAGTRAGGGLEVLTLTHNGLTGVGAAALGDALAGNTSLRKLTLARQELAVQVLRGEEQGVVAGLQTIDFSRQPLSHYLDYPVIARLVARNSWVARLRLCQAGLCGLNPDGRGRRGLEGSEGLAWALRAGPQRLTVLDIGHSFVDDASAEVLALGLRENRTLTLLSLRGNGLGPQGVLSLALSMPPSLMDLDLADNPWVGSAPPSGKAMTLLVRTGSLKRLDVSRCGLG
ncbi:unnamed protein product, partial [Discosporangium mesarthrocarpum]